MDVVKKCFFVDKSKLKAYLGNSLDQPKTGAPTSGAAGTSGRADSNSGSSKEESEEDEGNKSSGGGSGSSKEESEEDDGDKSSGGGNPDLGPPPCGGTAVESNRDTEEWFQELKCWAIKVLNFARGDAFVPENPKSL